MRIIIRVIFISLSLFIFYSSTALSADRGFPYKVLIGATGNEKQVKIKEKWKNIEFSESSNQEALKTLLGLRWNVLNKNSEGKFFLYGRKLDSFQIDIDGKTKIYYFVLIGWDIYCPFEFYVEPTGWVPGDNLEVVTKKRLDDSCFRYPVKINFGKYCR